MRRRGFFSALAVLGLTPFLDWGVPKDPPQETKSVRKIEWYHPDPRYLLVEPRTKYLSVESRTLLPSP